jgi:hypothetical protein
MVARKASPMTYIKGAKAPVLVRPGDGDRRPLPNADDLPEGGASGWWKGPRPISLDLPLG